MLALRLASSLSCFRRAFLNARAPPARSTLTSTAATASATAAEKSVPRIVGWWMGGVAGMAFGAVTLGGLTRLTESGLSMVDWKPLGRPPPLNAAQWEEELEKYRGSPEFRYKNADITMDQFKFIWWMEYGHRTWGRLIGAAFFLPAAAFWRKGFFTAAAKKRVVGAGVLLAFQGLLGWYMVKSGLDHDNFKGPADVPRVSQYRLAAHLSAAVVLYSLLLWNSLGILAPPPQPAKAAAAKCAKFRKLAMGCKTLSFLTIVSGAFVAGLDAGLVYNSFPMMADRFVPDDIFAYAPWLSNFTENPATVQFDHRILGVTTLAFITYVFLKSRGLPLHPRAHKAAAAMAFMGWAQVGLGIATLLFYVPTSVAAAHQAGALVTLSSALWLSHELKLMKIIKHVPK